MDYKKYEIKFLKSVVLRLAKKTWEKKDLQFIYDKFKGFIKSTATDEISLLRKGEFILKKYCDVDYTDMAKVKYYIESIIVEDIDLTISVVLIGTITKLAISDKIDYEEVKEK